MTWRERAALALLRRLWPRAFDLLLTALTEDALRAQGVVVLAEDVARMESEIRSAHASLFPHAFHKGVPVGQLVSDLRLAKVCRELGEGPCTMIYP